ncbi:hypothetical protein RI578_22825 [Streptomyces sp. BB1-1-1]|uniref:hypothetical protein n=1 Tax=Streptomyces sp. BB1-1-1 TaxID=3074430 RepID=UPI00287795F4|nr:hypothetical protein [Streptomyces sp. BB1-1-1]WND36945.1 hypothetical protein RI578_22825 [Streptomyces sp. BB1-1-1]
MPRIPDAVNVASLDTHCLIVTVPNHGPADVSSSLPRPAAAAVLRQIADQLEGAPCPTARATGRPCPVHDAPTAPRPRGLDALLAAVGDQLPQDDPDRAARGLADMTTPADRHPADGEQPRPHPNPFALDPEQVARAQQQLGEAFTAFGRKLRTAIEQAAATMQQADDDPRPRIEVDLEEPAEPEPVDTPPAVPTVVECAHGYGLLRDSCPGCDHEGETPHEADPVTIRPEWAKRNMRRCRRCTLRPSHPIHRAERTA